jgi:hypothetical protein
MQLFAENPHKLMDQFTDKFEKDFLELLSRRWGVCAPFAMLLSRHHAAPSPPAGLVRVVSLRGKCTTSSSRTSSTRT